MQLFRVGSFMILGLIAVVFFSCEKDLNSEPEAAQLKLISPDQNTEWNAGSECLIMWENGTGEPVMIDIYREDEFILNIGTFAHLMTEYLYTVPETLDPNGDYNLRLYNVEEPANFVVSQKFSILEKLNENPVCKIIDPRDGKYINSGDFVYITVEATDTDGEIDFVEFYIDGEYAGQMPPKSPYVFSWSTSGTEIGLHTIRAEAFDDDGASSNLSNVNVVITDGSSAIELIKIPSGDFMMGSSVGDFDEKPVNRVFMTKDFYMGKFEITNFQYAEILNFALEQNELTGDYPGNVTVMNLKGKQRELLDLDDEECGISFDGAAFYAEAGEESKPVIELTWWGAAFYCNMLSRQQNVEELYDLELWVCDLSKTGYRLPTEAEWEYAAKYNDRRTYPWGNSVPEPNRCNYALSVGRTTDVGTYSPSGDTSLGLCDMAGNAWEWCNDWYGYYPTTESFIVDPAGVVSGSSKILRGGNVNSSDHYIRTTYRNCYNLYSGYFYGMRLVLSIR